MDATCEVLPRVIGHDAAGHAGSHADDRSTASDPNSVSSYSKSSYLKLTPDTNQNVLVASQSRLEAGRT